ncbi:MAG: GNAT family N-acetyltransferase [Chloroflexota bacterium]
MSEAVIRSAVPNDAAAIARVRVETWRDAYRGLLPDEMLDGLSVDDTASTWRRLLEGADPSVLVLVAEVDGEIIGYSNAGPDRTGPDGDSGHGRGASHLPAYFVPQCNATVPKLMRR